MENCKKSSKKDILSKHREKIREKFKTMQSANNVKSVLYFNNPIESKDMLITSNVNAKIIKDCQVGVKNGLKVPVFENFVEKSETKNLNENSIVKSQLSIRTDQTKRSKTKSNEQRLYFQSKSNSICDNTMNESSEKLCLWDKNSKFVSNIRVPVFTNLVSKNVNLSQQESTSKQIGQQQSSKMINDNWDLYPFY